MKALFVDTNVFLHYRSIEEIDWLALTGVTEVLIIVPSVVLRELDKHKHSHPSAKIRKRARSIVARLNELFESSEVVNLRPGTRFTVSAMEPAIDFAAHHLRPDISDDFLIAAIIEYREKHSTDVALVAADYGLKLKARAKGIGSIPLDDTLRLPDEDDPQEKRIRELEAELRQSKNSLPVVAVQFDTGSQHVRFDLVEPEPFDEASIARAVDEIKREHPFWQTPPAKSQIQSGLRSLDSIPLDEINRYNRELEEYFLQYENYLKDLTSEHNAIPRTICLKLLLVNTGNCPAEDIDIRLHFPDGFSLSDEEPEELCTPNLPEPPRSLMERIQFQFPGSLLRTPLHSMPSFATKHNVSTPRIKRTNSYDVKWHVDKLKHGLKETLDTLYLTFDSFDEAKSFQIDYILHLGNAPTPTQGQLNVIIERQRRAT